MLPQYLVTADHYTCFRWLLVSDINISQSSVATRVRCGRLFNKDLTTSYHTTATVLRHLFWTTGESVPEENFRTLWCKGWLTKADTLTIRLGATPSGLTSGHLHQPPYFLQPRCPSCHPTYSVKALKAPRTFELGRRRKSSPQWCYLHRLRTSTEQVNHFENWTTLMKSGVFLFMGNSVQS